MGLFFYIKFNDLNKQISEPLRTERPYLSDVLEIQKLSSSLDLQLHKQIAGEIVDNDQTLSTIDTIFDKIDAIQQNNAIQGDELVHLGYFFQNLKKLRVALIYYKNNRLYDAASSSSEELYEIIDTTIVKINSELSAIISALRKHMNASNERALGSIKFIQKSLTITFSLVAAISLLVLFLFNKSLSKNLSQLIYGTNKLGEGDLQWRLNSTFNDEFGKLSHAFDEMAEKLSTSNEKIQKQTNKIKRLAFYDSLTELPNRNTFLERLQQEIERAERANEKLAVLFVDLDDFKLVNDMYGHDVGDLLLQEAAKRMIRNTRSSDTIARLGGDEFTIILPQQNSEIDSTVVSSRILDELNRPYSLSHKLLDELNKPFYIDEKQVSVSSSIGIAIFPDNGTTAKDILKNADTAMYAAKSEGKNSFMFCSKEMSERMSKMLEIEKDLRQAVINGNELILHYQPQVDLNTNQIAGLEALVRWIHPKKGFVPPLDFIPLAEDRGIIHDITKWVLQSTCRQQKIWLEKGRQPLPIMVNLSAKDFFRQDIEQFITNLLKEEGVAPQLIGIEVTETSVMKDRTAAINTLNKLKEMGIKIALDDFGTGYSSLNYLKTLPIDVVKIDRAFVQDIENDEPNKAITNAIVVMSHALKLTVLAEGVETESQQNIVTELACDSAQGYLFSKPVPAEEITTMLRKIP